MNINKQETKKSISFNGVSSEKCKIEKNNSINKSINSIQCKKIGNYIVAKTIGKGTFGKVKIGIHIPTGLKVAIKILDKSKIKDSYDIERISREIQILKNLRHPNLVQLYETITSNNHIYLIMELIEGEDLNYYISTKSKMNETKVLQIFQQLISAVEYIHSIGVVHRDIKPENILINSQNEKIKLVDFGLSNNYKNEELVRTACGSPCYAAPEMISGKPYYGLKSDLWSCGVVLFCLLAKSLPFDDKDIVKLYKKISEGDYKIPNFLSRDARDLIQNLLTVDVNRRFDFQQIKNHRWFTQFTSINHSGIILGVDKIDIVEDIIVKVKSLKIFRDNVNITLEHIRNVILTNVHNNITTAYYLLKNEINLGKESSEQSKNIINKTDSHTQTVNNITKSVNVVVINNIVTEPNSSHLSHQCHQFVNRIPNLNLSINTNKCDNKNNFDNKNKFNISNLYKNFIEKKKSLMNSNKFTTNISNVEDTKGNIHTSKLRELLTKNKLSRNTYNLIGDKLNTLKNQNLNKKFIFISPENSIKNLNDIDQLVNRSKSVSNKTDLMINNNKRSLSINTKNIKNINNIKNVKNIKNNSITTGTDPCIKKIENKSNYSNYQIFNQNLLKNKLGKNDSIKSNKSKDNNNNFHNKTHFKKLYENQSFNFEKSSYYHHKNENSLNISSGNSFLINKSKNKISTLEENKTISKINQNKSNLNNSTIKKNISQLKINTNNKIIQQIKNNNNLSLETNNNLIKKRPISISLNKNNSHLRDTINPILKTESSINKINKSKDNFTNTITPKNNIPMFRQYTANKNKNISIINKSNFLTNTNESINGLGKSFILKK